MTVSSIAGADSAVQGAAQRLSQQRRDGLQALIKNLQTGDMSGARHALVSLRQSFQTALQAGTGGNNTPVQRDLAAIGKALHSDDLAGAKQGLAAFMRDLQTQTPYRSTAVAAARLAGDAGRIEGRAVAGGIHVTA